MKENDLQAELSSIKSLMDRSTRFISLSGMSGIMAGIYALAGAAIAWKLTDEQDADIFSSQTAMTLYIVALLVLLLAVGTGVWLTRRKAERRGQSAWNPGSKALVGRILIPLITGGLLMNIFFFTGQYQFILPVSLIFYGLGLLTGAQYTISLVKYLGYLEIVLGLIAAALPAYGVYFWITGFGLLNILYGGIMHFKYER